MALVTEYLFGLAASQDPDTMTIDEALKQPDREEFVKAMSKELEDHVRRKHWVVVPLSSVPRNKIPIPMVWPMKRKRNPIGEIIKWKARLCANSDSTTGRLTPLLCHGVQLDLWSSRPC